MLAPSPLGRAPARRPPPAVSAVRRYPPAAYPPPPPARRHGAPSVTLPPLRRPPPRESPPQAGRAGVSERGGGMCRVRRGGTVEVVELPCGGPQAAVSYTAAIGRIARNPQWSGIRTTSRPGQLEYPRGGGFRLSRSPRSGPSGRVSCWCSRAAPVSGTPPPARRGRTAPLRASGTAPSASRP